MTTHHFLQRVSSSRRKSGSIFVCFFLFFAIFLLSSFSACASVLKNTSPPAPLPPLVFEDANGGQHALSDYKGRFILLNIWASWCGPCVHEMPSLAALQKNFDPAMLVILPLSEDRSVDLINVFYRMHALSFPVAIDTAGRAPSALHLRGLPTSILINPKGEEIARMEGDRDWSSTEIVEQLRARISGN